MLMDKQRNEVRQRIKARDGFEIERTFIAESDNERTRALLHYSITMIAMSFIPCAERNLE